MNEIVLAKVSAKHADLAYLIGKLDEELLERYPGEEIFGIDVEDPKIEEAVFVVAYHNGKAVGCGGIRPLDHESTELKRFYVDRSVRKQGIAQRILDFVEDAAKELNYSILKLETGAPQFEAVHFYKKNGFYEIDRFGEYADCPSSLCFEKRLPQP
ncbi:GNAT family N-acetyltransferase [Paenibacillus oenotherae]|uniref:GNAT family N-acetyltransferase n=1 Tax=Paenibacillus oenotherae TaxID=1435645 RepID=A0ABS7DCP8_9BACL|nr:GNAT family N-acetyltransferase [Paenibacillus oenotherae]MBW7476933.1 GNAT family N-acetyltransferase [Paenibacillus oenotherae]